VAREPETGHILEDRKLFPSGSASLKPSVAASISGTFLSGNVYRVAQ
jgi:hypothetical protein